MKRMMFYASLDRNLRKLIIALILMFALATPFNAGAENKDTEPEIRIITIAPTHNLFEWFGHIALEVDYGPGQRSVSYNFGGFSFKPEDLPKFTMGNFIFWSFVEDTQYMLNRYSRSGRHIVIQTLNLTEDQKRELVVLLHQATLPENVKYSYDHFRENCATRIRDILNNVLGNELYTRTAEISDLTYRELINRMTGEQWALNFFLNYLLSDRVDQPITDWESMFLPDRLMTVSRTVESENGESLIRSRIDLPNNNPSPYFEQENYFPEHRYFEWPIGVVLALITLTLFIIRRKSAGWPRKLYPFWISIYGLCAGVLGVALFFMSAVASHVDTYWNENLLFANPLTFLLFPAGVIALFNRGEKLYYLLSFCCGMLAFLGVLLKPLPCFDQVNSPQMIVFLPISILIGLTGIIENRR